MTAADEERRRFASEMRANGWLPSPPRRPLSTQEREAAMPTEVRLTISVNARELLHLVAALRDIADQISDVVTAGITEEVTDE